MLVTAVLIAATALLAGGLPPARTVATLIVAMLSAQLSIGALNDWADWRADAVSKPFKPIARGVVSRRAALGFAVTGFILSLAAAATLGVGVALTDALAIAAGAGYDLWLKRTPAAVLAWWAGFTALPLMAMAAAGRSRGAVELVPLAALLAAALLLANGLPDREGDSRGGGRPLPVVLGAIGSRAAIAGSLGVAALYAAAIHSILGQGTAVLVAAGLLAAGAVVPVFAGASSRVVFPVLAVVVAAASVVWLGALPHGG